jgi:hypothetical protein|tara:strand:+ start:233 stop:529 length:297 start_codon:yes stop_codon:yes gene_type:complete
VRRLVFVVCVGALLGVFGGMLLVSHHLAPLVQIESAASSALRRAKPILDPEEDPDLKPVEELQREIRDFLESPMQEPLEWVEPQSCPPCMGYIKPYMQ